MSDPGFPGRLSVPRAFRAPVAGIQVDRFPKMDIFYFYTVSKLAADQPYAGLQFWARRPTHATADEIFHAVPCRTDPRASRATVYNNLPVLATAAGARHPIQESDNEFSR
jgi:hypothetical protein